MRSIVFFLLILAFCSLAGSEEEGANIPVEPPVTIVSTDNFEVIAVSQIETPLVSQRRGGSRRRSLGRLGGSRASEAAVDRALRWFNRHQGLDGSWDPQDYPTRCPLPGPRCEPGEAHPDVGASETLTAQVVLTFLGAGYDHRAPSQFRRASKGGIDWLLTRQQENGSFSENNVRVDAQVTLALLEALAMTKDPSLQEPVQRAVGQLLAQQREHQTQRLGWALRSEAEMDTLTTGWVMQALILASALGLDVESALIGGRNFAAGVWQEAHNKPLLHWSAGQELSGAEALHLAGGLHLATWAWRDSDEAGDDARITALLDLALLRSLDEAQADHQVQEWPMNIENVLWASQAVFQLGHEHWPRWNDALRDNLINSQRRDEGCFEGSWDPQGTRFTGHQLGRLLVTAYATQALQTYYRYAPLRRD